LPETYHTWLRTGRAKHGFASCSLYETPSVVPWGIFSLYAQAVKCTINTNGLQKASGNSISQLIILPFFSIPSPLPQGLTSLTSGKVKRTQSRLAARFSAQHPSHFLPPTRQKESESSSQPSDRHQKTEISEMPSPYKHQMYQTINLNFFCHLQQVLLVYTSHKQLILLLTSENSLLFMQAYHPEAVGRKKINSQTSCQFGTKPKFPSWAQKREKSNL